MHRSIRWLVGTLASILGLGLLLVRWGLWASDSRLVVENTPAVRSMLIAAQNEPAFLIYGAVVFLLLVGFALLIPTSKWRKWVTGHKQNRSYSLSRRHRPSSSKSLRWYLCHARRRSRVSPLAPSPPVPCSYCATFSRHAAR